jgi:hypothetical protein
MPYIFHDDDPFRREEKVERVFHITDPRIPHNWIEQAAYYHWEKKGRPHGNSHEHWLEAEKELREKLSVEPKTPPPDEPPSKVEDPKHSWLA